MQHLAGGCQDDSSAASKIALKRKSNTEIMQICATLYASHICHRIDFHAFEGARKHTTFERRAKLIQNPNHKTQNKNERSRCAVQLLPGALNLYIVHGHIISQLSSIVFIAIVSLILFTNCIMHVIWFWSSSSLAVVKKEPPQLCMCTPTTGQYNGNRA